jgi:hypothetical protein
MGSCTGYSPTAGSRSARRIMVVLLALVVLMVATAGSTWHSHAGQAGSNCSICHFGQMPAQPALANETIAILVCVRAHLILDEPSLISNTLLPRSPSRAPPSA